MDKKELTDLFRRLGANDPEGWARSQLQEDIPQLARFVFLREAWRLVIAEEDSVWIDVELSSARRDPDAPYSGVGHALQKLRNRGATDDELTDLVRGVQAHLLFDFCRLLDDPGELEPEVSHIDWTFVQNDDEGNVVGVIDGLHESVLETDPTGREMRPRDGAD